MSEVVQLRVVRGGGYEEFADVTCQDCGSAAMRLHADENGDPTKVSCYNCRNDFPGLCWGESPLEHSPEDRVPYADE